MADINPYQPPQASVADEPRGTGSLRGEPHAVGAGRGVGWFGDGFTLFRQAPMIWIAMAVIAFVLMVVVGLIPFLGQILNPLVSMLLAGGFMVSCRAVDRGEELSVGHLFQAMQTHASSLLVVGALYVVGLLLVVVAVGVAGFGSVMTAMQMGQGQGQIPPGAGAGVALVVLLAVGLSIPLMMAAWFAPALVVLNDVAPVEAMKLSFRGCLRNIVPFLVYGVVGLVLGILASIPLMLGWLVMGPVLAGSMYAGYLDIFIDADAR